MPFSGDYLVSRHALALDAINLPHSLDLAEALNLENQGNWNGAAEAYAELENQGGSAIDAHNRVRLFARAATCFEICSRPESSARAYSNAARLLAQQNIQPQAAGELYNRSARQHYKANEFFFAGSSWRASATEFSKIGTTVIKSQDNIPPVPFSAAGLTVSGSCFTAAAEAFSRAIGNEMWACGAYWESGNAFAKTFPIPNIQTYDGYRNALSATIKYYGTLEVERIRSTLQLTEKERADKVDPLKVMEDALNRLHLNSYQHQSNMGDAARTVAAQLETNRQLSAAFHDFSRLLLDVGNGREAGIFRAAEKERQRRIYLAEKRYGLWAFYGLWRIAAGYGENLARWVLCCLAVTLSFSAAYYLFGALSFGAGYNANWFDYIYYSVVTFTSLGAADISPSGVIGKVLICAEIIFGLMMFGMLLSFVGSRIQR
jgi:Ion channel